MWEGIPHDHSLDEEALFSPEGKRKLYSLPPEEAKKELRYRDLATVCTGAVA